jgi:hypothetical protein
MYTEMIYDSYRWTPIPSSLAYKLYSQLGQLTHLRYTPKT